MSIFPNINKNEQVREMRTNKILNIVTIQMDDKHVYAKLCLKFDSVARKIACDNAVT